MQYAIPAKNRRIGKPVERLRRKAKRACNMAASRTLFSPGKVIRNLAPPCEDASASPSGERARSGPTRVQSVVPAVWPVLRSFVLAEIERVFGKNHGKGVKNYET